MSSGRRDLRFGLGPVFAFEWIAWSRRWQGYALRSLFAATLLAALLVALSNSRIPSLGVATFQDLARLGESFYVAVIGTQITLVLLVAPAATAGAVCLERASGKLTHVLLTDLSDSEIVLGKLAARLVPVLGLVACALPLMAILVLIGGVDPDALLGATLVTVCLAVLGTSIAFVLSIWARKAQDALLGTYAIWGLWLLANPFVGLLNAAWGWSLAVPSFLADPYTRAFAHYWPAGASSWGADLAFLAVTSGIAAALAALAVFRIRTVCTRVDVARPGSLRGRLSGHVERLDPTRRLPGPSLDFNPVLWREWHRSRASRLARASWVLYWTGSAVASVAAIVAPRSTFAMAWVNGLQVSIGMLLLSVAAATSLAEERVRGGLDVLMATTLSTREIVLGKWLGTFRLVPWLAALPTLVVLFSNPTHWNYLPDLVMTPLFVLVCGAAVTGFGLMMATWVPRLGRALTLTVAGYVLVAVGWLFVELSNTHGPEREGPMMASPFYFAGVLAADLCTPSGVPGQVHFKWGVLWTVIYAAAAVGFLAVTLGTFNRCLGRVEFGVSSEFRRSPKPLKMLTEVDFLS